MYLKKIYRHSKFLFMGITLFVIAQLYYSFQFAKLVNWVDNGIPVPHPVADEMLPFVNYNMYSGKVNDWNNYYCFRVFADGEEILVTDKQVIVEEYWVNPLEKFLQQQPDFQNAALKNHVQHLFGDNDFSEKLYLRISNEGMTDDDFKNWYKRFCERVTGKKINELVVVKENYAYADGRPNLLSQEEVLKI